MYLVEQQGRTGRERGRQLGSVADFQIGVCSRNHAKHSHACHLINELTEVPITHELLPFQSLLAVGFVDEYHRARSKMSCLRTQRRGM